MPPMLELEHPLAFHQCSMSRSKRRSRAKIYPQAVPHRPNGRSVSNIAGSKASDATSAVNMASEVNKPK